MNTKELLFQAGASRLVDGLATLYATWPEVLSQFEGTTDRLVRMYSDFCWSEDEIKSELDKQFKVFENTYDEMIVVKDIHVWTLCPHHLLPCEFRVFIGCLPAKGRVLGLSKFARVSEVLAKRPVMQEQYSTELADILDTRLRPRGIGVTVYGKHGCMTARGVKQHSEVVTSVVRGDFLKEEATRAEFLAICRDREH